MRPDVAELQNAYHHALAVKARAEHAWRAANEALKAAREVERDLRDEYDAVSELATVARLDFEGAFTNQSPVTIELTPEQIAHGGGLATPEQLAQLREGGVL